MKKVIFLFSLTIITVVSCKKKDQQHSDQLSGIRFGFKAYYSDSYKSIAVEASLYNDNRDTVYLLNSTCDGLLYALDFDTADFRMDPLTDCNGTNPEIKKIAPYSQLDFRAHFIPVSGNSLMRLGFDFNRVGRDFDLSSVRLRDVFDRPLNQRQIKWAYGRII